MDVVKFRPHQVKLFFSNKFVYGQIIRLVNGEHSVVAAASTIEKGLQEGLESKSDKAACVRCAWLGGAGSEGTVLVGERACRYAVLFNCEVLRS